MILRLIFILFPSFLLAQTQIGNILYGDEHRQLYGNSVDIDYSGRTIITGSGFGTDCDINGVAVYDLTGDTWTQRGETFLYSNFEFGLIYNDKPKCAISGDGKTAFLWGIEHIGEDSIVTKGYAYKYVDDAWTKVGNTIILEDHYYVPNFGYFTHSFKVNEDGTVIALAYPTSYYNKKIVGYNLDGNTWKMSELKFSTNYSSYIYSQSIDIDASGKTIVTLESEYSNPETIISVFKNNNGWELETSFKLATNNLKKMVAITLSGDGNTICTQQVFASNALETFHLFKKINENWEHIADYDTDFEHVTIGSHIDNVNFKLNHNGDKLYTGSYLGGNDIGRISIFKVNNSGFEFAHNIEAVDSGSMGYNFEIDRDGNTIVCGEHSYTANDTFGRVRVLGTADLFASTTETVDTDGISIYPNPTSGSFSIKFDNLWRAGRMVIFDAIGQQILAQDFNEINEGSYNFSLGASGIYYMVFHKNGKTITKTLLVE